VGRKQRLWWGILLNSVRAGQPPSGNPWPASLQGLNSEILRFAQDDTAAMGACDGAPPHLLPRARHAVSLCRHAIEGAVRQDALQESHDLGFAGDGITRAGRIGANRA